MSKLTLSDVNNLLGSPTSAANTINSNNATVQSAFENTLSRDGTSPNQMGADLDMNHFSLLNVDVIDAATFAFDGSPDFQSLIEDAETAATNSANSATASAASAALAAQYQTLAFNSSIIQNFTSDGSTVAYALTSNPGSANNIEVFVDGIYQHPSTWTYTNTGTPTVTLSEAAPNLLPITFKYGNAISTGTPADGSVTTVKLADNAVTAVKLSNSDIVAIQAKVFPVGSVIQSVSGVYSAVTGLTATIPLDDTIPQNTEGTQIISVSITPKSTTNKLRCRFSGYGTGSVTGDNFLTSAIFSSLSANAIVATTTSVLNSYRMQSVCEGEFVPGVTTSVTISVRVAPSSGTLYMNGNGVGTHFFGSAGACRLTVEEIVA